MTRIPHATTDPLSAFLREHVPEGHAIPLVSTEIDVEIRYGVVVVSTTRLFRNDEDGTIEATMTFPVPVHATLHALEARIGSRTLTARASRSDAARETYEDAMHEGRTSVLHEEILKGLHMLSVGAVGPGEEVEVTLRWCSTLAIDGDFGTLRIPTTLGDVYGCPPFPDSDAPIHGGDVQRADLRIRCMGGQAALDGHTLDENGRAEVMLDAPLDIRVTKLVFAPLEGRAADGRTVRLSLQPTKPGHSALDLALLIDRSGSMGGEADYGLDRTKHQQVLSGLETLARHLTHADQVETWEFDTDLDWLGRVTGSAPGEAFRNLLQELGEPRGGTELGRAMKRVIGSGHRDLLVVTDGKSYAIDVQALVRSGTRVTVLLIGEDSLDGSIAHLATLSGGEVFIAAGSDIQRSMEAALASMRRDPSDGRVREDGGRHRLKRRGVDLEICWDAATGSEDVSAFGRAIGALAAGLVLPALDEEAAAAVALSEGLVTHLTSLVLVDAEGQVHDGLPATRKIPLLTPQEARILRPRFLRIPDADNPVTRERIRQIEAKALRKLKYPNRSRKLRSFLDGDLSSGEPEETVSGEAQDPMTHDNLLALARTIDWSGSPSRLVAGDLSDLDPVTAGKLWELAGNPRITEEANRLSMDPILVVIGLLARALAPNDRTAARVERSLFGDREVLDLPGSTHVEGVRDDL